MGLDVIVNINARELMRIMTWYEVAAEHDKILPEDVDTYNKIKVIRKEVSEEEGEDEVEEISEKIGKN